MRREDLTPEQIEEAKKLSTTEEILKYARENEIDLTDEEMESISGGDGMWKTIRNPVCPYCNSSTRTHPEGGFDKSGDEIFVCDRCDQAFTYPVGAPLGKEYAHLAKRKDI